MFIVTELISLITPHYWRHTKWHKIQIMTVIGKLRWFELSFERNVLTYLTVSKPFKDSSSLICWVLIWRDKLSSVLNHFFDEIQGSLNGLEMA